MDAVDISRIFFSLLAVLGMIGLLAAIARFSGRMPMGPLKARERRIRIGETVAIDNRRKLCIVQCDDREHLVLLGPETETVIERNIERTETALKSGDLDLEGRGMNPFAKAYADAKRNGAGERPEIKRDAA